MPLSLDSSPLCRNFGTKVQPHSGSLLSQDLACGANHKDHGVIF